MKQFQPTPDELTEIGFTKRVFPADELNEEKIAYEIPCVNSVFYCNMNEDIYVWYYKTTINEASNHVHLDIGSRPELFLILSNFRVQYNFVV